MIAFRNVMLVQGHMWVEVPIEKKKRKYRFQKTSKEKVEISTEK